MISLAVASDMAAALACVSKPTRSNCLGSSPLTRGLNPSSSAERKVWEHRVSLLHADRLDPDLLDERARAMLNYAHPRDLVLTLKK